MAILVGTASMTAQTGCGSCPCDTISQHHSIDGVFRSYMFDTRPDGLVGTQNLIPNRSTAAFVFQYQCDSSDFTVAFAEFQVNRNLTALHAHCLRKVWNWNDSTSTFVDEISDATLRTMSRTRWFSVSPGDTVGFYRLFVMRQHITNAFLTERWVAPDAISFAVELLDSATNQRLALLDTFRLSSTTPSGAPSFYTRYPMASSVRAVVPAGITAGQRVAIRTRVYSDGPANERWTRSDILMYAPSLNGPRNYGPSWKALAQHNVAFNGTCPPFVTTSPGTITVSTPSTPGGTMLEVLTPYGNPVGSVPLPLAGGSATLSVPAGACIVAVKGPSNTVLCTNLVAVP